MAVGAQAELIYVRGPQAGQRAALTLAVVTVGRGQQADVQLTEEHVSRKQFQLTLTQDGWVFENLSPLRSRVNGKKYKTGKKIFLDTGDVVAVGSETELLFVASGDDPEAALIAYRQGDGASKPKPAPTAPTAPPAPGSQAGGGDEKAVALEEIEATKPAAGNEYEDDEEEAELDDEQLAALAQKAKVKKYAIIFGAYLGGLAVVVLLLVMMLPERGTHTKGGRPVRLSVEEIDDYINARLSRDRNTAEANIAQTKALLFLQRTNEVDHLYRAIYAFKLAKAHGKVLSTENERLFKDASKRLTNQVWDKYLNAYAHERATRFVPSERIFREILDMIPSLGQHGESNELRENIKAHIAYIKISKGGSTRG
ncbi:MAG: FHA domain-containing protein [Phycisphaerales bacterium]|jgi:hypothetical protein|nr:FHA domain-containing protein [Phycisphaerales bacterium]